MSSQGMGGGCAGQGYTPGEHDDRKGCLEDGEEEDAG